MKTLRLALVAGLIVVLIIFAGGMAYAAGNYSGDGGRSGSSYRGSGRDGEHSGGRHRGGGHDHGHRRGYYWGGYGSVVIGAPYWGFPWYSPLYYPYYDPFYPYEPLVTVPSRPQEYIERPKHKSSPRQSGVWYFCPESNAYYPYVRECQGGWQKVPAQPPSEIGR